MQKIFSQTTREMMGKHKFTISMVSGIIVSAACLQYFQISNQEQVTQQNTVQVIVYEPNWIPHREKESDTSHSSIPQHSHYRSKDKFEYNVRTRPTGTITPQKVNYHLSLKEKHDTCGHIYKKASDLENRQHFETLQFLYECCILNQVDNRINGMYRDMGIHADRVTRDLSNELLPKYETKIKQDRADKVFSNRKWNKLKQGETIIGHDYHIILGQMATKETVDQHLFM
jgi:hypothetical protein